MKRAVWLGVVVLAGLAMFLSGCGGGGGGPALTPTQAEQLVSSGFATMNGVTSGASADPAGDASKALNDFNTALPVLPNDPEANVGWAIARAAKLWFDTGAVLPGLTRDRSAALIMDPRKILGNLGGSYVSASQSLGRVLVPPLPRLLGRQAGGPTPEQVRLYLVMNVAPVLVQIIQHLDLALAAPSIDVTITVSVDGLAKQYKVDKGDVYLVKGCVSATLAVVYDAVPYSLEYGAWNWQQVPVDKDGDGNLSPAEYLPPSPFLTLVIPTAFASAKAAMLAGADAVIAGADTNLHPGGETDLVDWTIDPQVNSDLSTARTAAQDVKSALATARYPVTIDSTTVNINLSAWATAPPPDLKALFPMVNVDPAMQQITIVSWPDLTFAGLLPDSLPTQLAQNLILPWPWQTG